MIADPNTLPTPTEWDTKWWVVFLRGLIVLGLSIFAFFQPAETVVVLVKVLAIYLILDGFVMLYASLFRHSGSGSRGMLILRSMITILGGGLVFAYATFTVQVSAVILSLILGSAAVIGGFLDMVKAVRIRKAVKNEWAIFLGGLLLTVFGVFVLLSPTLFSALLVQLLAILAGIGGMLMLILALQQRNLQKGP